jgi:anti-anti-sigma regulatory factor
MTLRIDRRPSADGVVLRLIGDMRGEEIEEVRTEVAGSRQVVLDIGELVLVGSEGICFLNACQDRGVCIVNASSYISDWMLLERDSEPTRT